MSDRGVSGFWLDIKAIEIARTTLIAELGAKEGMLAYGVWVRLFTWQYHTATPIKDAAHVARLTGLNVRTAQRLLQSLAQSLPRSLHQRLGQWYVQRTMQVLDKARRNQGVTRAQYVDEKQRDPDPDLREDLRKEKENVEKKSPRLKSFKKPSLGEVEAYCQERGKGVNPEAWMDHYTSNGWKVGKNPMRDWKAAVRTWERNHVDKMGNGNGRAKTFDEIMSDLDTGEAGEVLGGDGQPVRTSVVQRIR